MNGLARTVRTVAGGLRRLLGAPGLWVGCWLALAGLSWLVGAQVQLVAAAAVGPFDALDLDRVVFGVADVVRVHPEVMAGLVAAVLGGSVMSAVGWLLASPVVIARLAGHRGLRELGERGLGALPAVAVQSLWHAVLRGVLMVVVLLSAQPLPVPWVVSLGLLAWLAAGVALDATRVAVVEHGAAPWHIKTAWQGLLRVARRPRVLGPGIVLGLGQVVTSAAIVWLALAGLGGGTAWGLRALALVGVGLGLWRVAIVVEDAAADDA
jgi:hypothetical protein